MKQELHEALKTLSAYCDKRWGNLLEKEITDAQARKVCSKCQIAQFCGGPISEWSADLEE